MPVTICLKAIGMTPEAISRRSTISTPSSSPRAATSRTGAERLRGEVARFDFVDKAGRRSCRRTSASPASTFADMEAAGMKRMAVPDEFLMGRTLAHNVINKDSGEILANANDEITEPLLAKLSEAGIETIKTSTPTTSTKAGTFRRLSRSTRPPIKARRASPSNRMMRPASRPRKTRRNPVQRPVLLGGPL